MRLFFIERSLLSALRGFLVGRPSRSGGMTESGKIENKRPDTCAVRSRSAEMCRKHSAGRIEECVLRC